MYEIKIYNAEGIVLEALCFVYREEAEAVAEAFENLTDYSVVCDWEEQWP